MVYRMVYVSAATAPLDADALLALLTRARDKNQRLGITGLLLYRDGDFIQLLEGEREAVANLITGNDVRAKLVISEWRRLASDAKARFLVHDPTCSMTELECTRWNAPSPNCGMAQASPVTFS